MNPSYFDVNQGAGFLTHPHLIPMDFEYPIFSETNILQLSLSVDLPRVWVPQTQPQGELGWHVVPLSVQQTYIHYNLIYNIYNIYICSILQYIYIIHILQYDIHCFNSSRWNPVMGWSPPCPHEAEADAASMESRRDLKENRHSLAHDI